MKYIYNIYYRMKNIIQTLKVEDIIGNDFRLYIY